MKNLNDLLARRDTAQDFLTQGLFPYARDKTFRDLEIDIRLEQRKADLPQRVVNVRLADCAVTAQVLENVLKFIAELRKHALVQFAFAQYAGCAHYPEVRGHTSYLFGVADGDIAGEAPGGAAPPSMAKLQCPWTFLPPDFASTTTLTLSRSFCVTWYEAVFVFASNDAGTTPRPLTRICTLPGSIWPKAERF